MSFNGSGTFNINTSGQPVVTGTVISSTVFNALTADLATGLSTCITKDGQTTVSANIPMNSFKFTGLAAGTAATDSARLGQVQAGTATVVTVTGTDTYVGTMSPPLTAYAAGNMFTFVVPNTNTTGCTLNIDSVGAKALTRDGSTALVAGDLVANSEVVVVYDGTRFQVLNSNSKTNLNLSGNFTVAGSITASGGTANGVLYLNGSKVATSGSALVFDGTNLGIGTASPSTFGKLAIVGTSYFAGGASSTEQARFGYTDGTSYWGMGRDNVTTGNFIINKAGSTIATFDTNGNLGLGVTPSAWGAGTKALQMQGGALWSYSTGYMDVMQNAYYNGTNNIYSTTAAASFYRQNAGSHYWYNAPSGTAGTTVTFTQAMSLNANQQLTVGDGSAASTYDPGVLFLNGSTASSRGPSIRFQTGSTTNSLIGSYSTVVSGTATWFACANSGGGGVYLNGASATSWTAVSDETRKVIIEDITDAANKVSTLRTVIGRLKTDDESVRRPYLIAQDVQKVLPEAVSENEDKEGPVLGLSYTETIPLLVAAIKELTARVAQLEAK